jgi:antitoxin (DNA-binding transcriptional repressor) of toxin-antitoxin stability system
MKRASISEAKNGLSALLDRVRQGQSVVIEDRGVPVARLEALGGAAPEGRLARLERDGLITRAPARLPASFFTERPPRTRHGRTASDLLIDERRDSR